MFKIIKLVLVDNRCIKCINRAVQRVLWQNRDRPAGKMGKEGWISVKFSQRRQYLSKSIQRRRATKYLFSNTKCCIVNGFIG